MTINRTSRGDYLAQYKGLSATGYTIEQAIINLLTIL
jgi:hypothetical protein